MHGKNAKDLIIKVPLGTVITNLDTNLVIADIVDKNDVKEENYESMINNFLSSEGYVELDYEQLMIYFGNRIAPYDLE